MKKDVIRISDILYGIIKHRILIVSLTVAGLLIGVVLSGISFLRGEMSKQYIITSSFSVNTQTEGGLFVSGEDYPGYNDINMSEDLAGTVSYILKSDMMLEDVINSLELLGVTTKNIYDNLTLHQYEETQVIEMTLSWRGAHEGISILTELNKRAPEVLQETLSIGTISVLNEPAAKYIIGGNIDVILWAYTALIGLAVGLGITIFKLFTRPTLINVKDVKELFKKETLCEIAEDRAFFEKRKSLLSDDVISPDVWENFASAAHIVHNRLCRTEGPHIVYVTSTLRGEGKTSAIANLAVQLSKMEKHVLLLDLDTRNPSLGGMFLGNVEYAHSLNAFYAGDISKAEAVTSLTGYLDIMPTILERTSIPLDSNLFNVIQKIAEDYDYVLIDTAPVGLTADPMNFAQIADAALFVIRFDDAALKEIKEAIDRLDKLGVDVLGCIVNGVKTSRKGIQSTAKEKEKIRKAEAAINTIGDPLVNAETPRALKDFDTGVNSANDPLVTEFADVAAANESGKEAEIVTSSGDFIDRLFQDDGAPAEEQKDETKK